MAISTRGKFVVGKTAMGMPSAMNAPTRDSATITVITAFEYVANHAGLLPSPGATRRLSGGDSTELSASLCGRRSGLGDFERISAIAFYASSFLPGLALAGVAFTFVLLGNPYCPLTITCSPGWSPFRIWIIVPCLIPVFTSCAYARLSDLTTITEVRSFGPVKIAAAGITSAFATVLAVIDTCAVVPGFSSPFGLSASTHTSSVVLLGSSA